MYLAHRDRQGVTTMKKERSLHKDTLLLQFEFSSRKDEDARGRKDVIISGKEQNRFTVKAPQSNKTTNNNEQQQPTTCSSSSSSSNYHFTETTASWVLNNLPTKLHAAQQQQPHIHDQRSSIILLIEKATSAVLTNQETPTPYLFFLSSLISVIMCSHLLSSSLITFAALPGLEGAQEQERRRLKEPVVPGSHDFAHPSTSNVGSAPLSSSNATPIIRSSTTHSETLQSFASLPATVQASSPLSFKPAQAFLSFIGLDS